MAVFLVSAEGLTAETDHTCKASRVPCVRPAWLGSAGEGSLVVYPPAAAYRPGDAGRPTSLPQEAVSVTMLTGNQRQSSIGDLDHSDQTGTGGPQL